MILSILKIIGIILLVILALLILILGMILFVPIRYWFAGEYEGSPKADVLVKWSPILLNATLNYKDNKLEYVVRMLGGVVMTNMDIPLSWIGRKFFSSDDKENHDDENEMELEGPKSEPQSQIIEKQVQDEHGKSLKRVHKKPKQSIVKKIRNKIQDIKRKVKEFIDKLRKLNEKREALLKVYHHKRFDVAKKDAIAYIKALWNIIKPKRLEGRIHFGLEDPASTGQVLGVIAMFLVWYQEFLRIEPDFEKTCFDGYLKGNGKIRLFPIVKLVIKVMLNKNLIKVIKRVQTIIEA